MNVISNSGEVLNAAVATATIDGDFGLVFESRGGAKGQPNERNSDYAVALTTVLGRLKSLGVESFRAYLASSLALATWAKEARALPVDGKKQIDLSARTAADLQHQLGRAMQNLKLDPATRGGNPTKRILLIADLNGEQWKSIVLGGKADVLSTEADIMSSSEPFDPKSLADSKERQLRSLAVRRGQPTFRKKLLEAYEGRCVVSRTPIIAVLEAAHIIPFRGDATNHVNNGLLMRADVHSLFDLGLIGIDQDYRIWIDQSLSESDYAVYHMQLILLPSDSSHYPSKEALATRPLPKQW